MPKPWKGGLGDGTDIGEVCLQAWVMLERSLSDAKLAVQFVKSRIMNRWTTYTFASLRLNPMELSSLFYEAIVEDVVAMELKGKDVTRLMFAISPPAGVIALHPIQAQYNIVTGLWDFRVGVAYEEVIVEVEVRRDVGMKQVSLKAPQSPYNLPEETPNSKSSAICIVEWTAKYVAETDKAVLVRDMNNNWERWVPKSQMSDEFQTTANGKYITNMDKQPPTISFSTTRWLWAKVRQELRQEAAMKQRQQAALGGLKRQSEMDAERAQPSGTDRPLTPTEVGTTAANILTTTLEFPYINMPASLWDGVRMDSFGDIGYGEPKSSRPKKPKNEPKVTIVKVIGKRKLDI